MSAFTEGSLQRRRELAYACRILAANGQNDKVYGHVSYREAGAKTFWMKPAALGLDEITPETLIRLDLEGNVVERENIFGEGMLSNVWNYYCRRIGPL